MAALQTILLNPTPLPRRLPLKIGNYRAGQMKTGLDGYSGRLIDRGIAAPAGENPPHTATANRDWHPDTSPI